MKPTRERVHVRVSKMTYTRVVEVGRVSVDGEADSIPGSRTYG